MGSRNSGEQRVVTRLALGALTGTGFALAGSGAIREHGLIDRPTEDVDLFTSSTDVDAFGRAVERVRKTLEGHGYSLESGRRTEQFARLLIHTPSGEQIDVDMGMDWRERETVLLQVGPVLSIDDAVGNKVSALYSRAEARDFLDVDDIRCSALFSDEGLLAAAQERDPGFEPAMFAKQLGRAARLSVDRVSEYGVDEERLDGIRERFARRATRIRQDLAGG